VAVARTAATIPVDVPAALVALEPMGPHASKRPGRNEGHSWVVNRATRRSRSFQPADHFCPYRGIGDKVFMGETGHNLDSKCAVRSQCIDLRVLG